MLNQAIASPASPEIVAHRGASFDAPENTVASVRLAWEQNADAVEIDIRLSRDAQVVVMHDPSTKRTAERDLPVSTQLLLDLKKLDAGSWKDPRWKGEGIPALSEVLALVPEKRRIFIEIKCGIEILAVLPDLLKASHLKQEQMVLIGFDEEVMRQSKRLFPGIESCWLVAARRDPHSGEILSLEEILKRAKAIGVDGLDLDARFPIDAGFVARIKAEGLKLYVWTVDDAGLARKLQEAGIDGITTNRPAWMREALTTPTP